MSSKDCRKLDGECQGWHSSNPSAKPANASGICNLLDLNHVLRRTFPDLFRPLGDFPSQRRRSISRGPRLPPEEPPDSLVSALANVGDQVRCSRGRECRTGRRALASACGEDVDLVMAMRAVEVAMFSTMPMRSTFTWRNISMALRPSCSDTSVGRGDDDGSGERHGLNQRDRHIAGARRQIDDQIVELAPIDALDEFADHLVEHGPAPHQRLVSRD